MTSRELVKATLEFRNKTGRVPRQLWNLRWAEIHHGEELDAIKRDFPDDIGYVHVDYAEQTIAQGEQARPGVYTDEWGCKFINIQDGVVGEVKEPQIPAGDEGWESFESVHIPTEQLSFDVAQVSAECPKTDRFVMGGFCPRPFEQLQFIRGTENLYMDLLDPPENMLKFMRRMHEFYCAGLEKWAQTDVDALPFMDDWGSQKSLLIAPSLWREIFKPMYKDYIDIAHSAGKKCFMHSDGHILAVIPDLIELGLDALNSQIFCMGVQNLAPFKGKITFWGEIDRQYLLARGTPEEITAAVRLVRDTLWADGGCIAQMEFGAGGRTENVRRAFEAWDSRRIRRPCLFIGVGGPGTKLPLHISQPLKPVHDTALTKNMLDI